MMATCLAYFFVLLPFWAMAGLIWEVRRQLRAHNSPCPRCGYEHGPISPAEGP